MSKLRILLAEDHRLVADAFKKLLEPEFEVVGSVTDGRALLEVAPALSPDVVLIDIGMPLLNGLDAGERLKRLIPAAKLIVLTMTEDSEMASEVLRTWASGYLLKKSGASELIKAIHEVLKGKIYVSPGLRSTLLDKLVRDPRQHPTSSLTERQREVLQLLAEGRTMKEVADVLHVATRTVAFHKYRIMEQFGLKTNSDLIFLALKQHLIKSSQ
jgi:DNA-binding NarL/FixJ family response regulator